MSIDPARLSFNEITADHLSLEQVVEACAEAGIGWLAPWRHKLTPGGAELIRHAGLRVSSLCRGGFFPARAFRYKTADHVLHLVLGLALAAVGAFGTFGLRGLR